MRLLFSLFLVATCLGAIVLLLKSLAMAAGAFLMLWLAWATLASI